MVDILQAHSNDARIRPMPSYQLDDRDLRELLADPPIDRDVLLARCMDSVDFALQLLNQFARTSQSRLDLFDAALQERDHVRISTAAHGLKGVAAILTANVLMAVCAELETTSEANNWNTTRDQIRRLNYELRRLVDFIPNLRR